MEYLRAMELTPAQVMEYHIALTLEMQPSQLKPDTHLFRELGVSSLHLTEIDLAIRNLLALHYGKEVPAERDVLPPSLVAALGTETGEGEPNTWGRLCALISAEVAQIEQTLKAAVQH